MTVPADPPPPSSAPAAAALPAPRWGLGDAAVGWIVAQGMAVLGAGIVLGATGGAQPLGQFVLDRVNDLNHTDIHATVTPLAVVAVLQAFLWVGLLGVPLFAAKVKGNGVVADFGLRFKPVDVPVGIAAGLLSQFVLVPLVSLPWLWALGKSSSDLEKVARDLADRATDPLGVVLLVLIVVVGAPIVEELFFRGLLLRSLQRHMATPLAVGISALVFGLTHFQLLQLPALVAFGVVLGVLAVRSGRLGPGIVAHCTFNAATVVSLLAR